METEPETTNPQPLWSLEKTMAFFGVSRRTIQRWVQDQGMPYMRPGGPSGEYKFDEDEVREWAKREGRSV